MAGFTIRLPRQGGEEDGDYGSEAGGEEEYDAEGNPIGVGKPYRIVQGKPYLIENNELVTEENAKGNEKVDEWGNLLGGRQFKAVTFVIPTRHPKRLYMLALDAARTSGFKDSLTYFRRNPLAYKLSCTQAEKEYLIGIGKLGTHLKTRSVTLITARSAYKSHGAKMVVDGRWVIDDYDEEKGAQEAAARGAKPGDLVGDLFPPPPKEDATELYNAGLGNAPGQGLGVYRAGGPTTIFGGSGLGPFSDGPLNAVRKSLLTRDGLNEENWMAVIAERVLAADEEWKKWRADNLKTLPLYEATLGGSGIPGDVNGKRRRRETSPPRGVREAHTGLVFHRADTQPTRCQWVEVDQAEETHSARNGISPGRCLRGKLVGSNAFGLAWVDTVMDTPWTAEPSDTGSHGDVRRIEEEERRKLWASIPES
ncbi:hypothetical protein FISHEDRAFT_40908 [Fistulina hepatica ATCC 64428]|uniref:Uncharacterized protein n=1 Tax=Fistulina hepatica ATCC 64428 TaxID=1128425 RepID=A0A0D7AFA3_9AGAR|nr:hypothetical protein FISHEDRAFT_40908 [Fistulina hepatica ATCC 64428]